MPAVSPGKSKAMKNLLWISLAILATSCCKKSDDDGTISPCLGASPCLEAKLESFKTQPDAAAIKTQIVGGETHYWLNTNATWYDGVEYILGECCDTVCFFCGQCQIPACNDDYINSNWETIWEK